MLRWRFFLTLGGCGNRRLNDFTCLPGHIRIFEYHEQGHFLSFTSSLNSMWLGGMWRHLVSGYPAGCGLVILTILAIWRISQMNLVNDLARYGLSEHPSANKSSTIHWPILVPIQDLFSVKVSWDIGQQLVDEGVTEQVGRETKRQKTNSKKPFQLLKNYNALKDRSIG